MKHGISANFAVASKEPLTDCIDEQDRFDRLRSVVPRFTCMLACNKDVANLGERPIVLFG